jgi:hypothetical protein
MRRVTVGLATEDNPGNIAEVLLDRVPVRGDVLHHEGVNYHVEFVVFFTEPGAHPYVVGKRLDELEPE